MGRVVLVTRFSWVIYFETEAHAGCQTCSIGDVNSVSRSQAI